MNTPAMFRLLQPNTVWSMALYDQARDFSFDDELGEPIKVFDSRQIRTGVKHVHSRGDPFVFVWKNELYLFFESMAVREPGCIALYKTTDMKEFEYVGVVLKEPHHLSYPLIFEHASSVFMMPESSAAGNLCLYRFEDFPKNPKNIRVLLTGNYVDSSLMFHNGLWYVFTTSPQGLEVFYTDDIEHGALLPHRQNPLTNDPGICRCGGMPVIVSGRTYRLAQDCSKKYGGNLNILQIHELNPDRYREELVYKSYFGLKKKWNADGGHHLSMARFRGRTVLAVDGRQPDYLVNKFLSPFFSAWGRVVHR